MTSSNSYLLLLSLTCLSGILVFVLAFALYKTFKRLQQAATDNPMTFRETCNFTQDSTKYMYNTSIFCMIIAFVISGVVVPYMLYKKKHQF